MEKDEVAARSVIQNKAILLQKTDDLAWFDGRQFGHITVISSTNATKPAVTVGDTKKWKTF
ncbi:MAG: hypothetical protein WA254_12665 [Candidatus Sulfotelmatobacter sp.]